MKSMAKRIIPHMVWVMVCASIIVFSGVSSSNKDGQPLTRDSFAKVAAKTLPAVVSININHPFTGKENPLEQFGEGPFGGQIPDELKPNKDFWEFFEFHRPQIPDELLKQDEQGRRWIPVAGGSGCIIRKDGYIVTNRHVIEPAIDNDKVDLVVALHDGRVFSREKKEVEIKGADELRDVAVLKINASDLPTLEWGDSGDLQIGDWVLAVGNPLDLEGTASEGIVSQKHRHIEKAPIEDLLQTTAMINPGNSGGALVDLDGQLVGINMAIATNTGRWQGVGFAVPSSDAKWIAESIVEHGKVIQGYIGVTMSEETAQRMSNQTAKYYDLPKPEGVLIDDCSPNGPAAKAGLKKGDVIVSVKDETGKVSEIKKNEDLLVAIASRKVGASVEVTYYRGGAKKTASVVIAERPSGKELEELKGAATPELRKGNIKDMGVILKEITDPEKGLQIVRVDPKGPAAKAEPIALKAGDIIKEVDDVAVATPDDVRNALKSGGKEGMHRVRFIRQNLESQTYVKF